MRVYWRNRATPSGDARARAQNNGPPCPWTAARDGSAWGPAPARPLETGGSVARAPGPPSAASAGVARDVARARAADRIQDTGRCVFARRQPARQTPAPSRAQAQGRPHRHYLDASRNAHARRRFGGFHYLAPGNPPDRGRTFAASCNDVAFRCRVVAGSPRRAAGSGDDEGMSPPARCTVDAHLADAFQTAGCPVCSEPARGGPRRQVVRPPAPTDAARQGPVRRPLRLAGTT